MLKDSQNGVGGEGGVLLLLPPILCWDYFHVFMSGYNHVGNW